MSARIKREHAKRVEAVQSPAPLPRFDITVVEARIARIVRGLGLCVHHCHEADVMQGEQTVPEKLFAEQLEGASHQAREAEADLAELNDFIEALAASMQKRLRQQREKGGSS